MFVDQVSCSGSLKMRISDLPCTPEEQRYIVSELKEEAEANLDDGNVYFVISNRWYEKWEIYVGLRTDDSDDDDVDDEELPEHPSPGFIDNLDIIERGTEDDPQLRKGLEEFTDYVLVPSAVWTKLVEWYKGGPPIPRKMFCYYTVDAYPYLFTLTDSRDNSSTVIILSGQETLSKLFETVGAQRKISKEMVCLWVYNNKKKGARLYPISNTKLEDSRLLKDQAILLEVVGSAWSAPTSGLKKGEGKGFPGLYNFGNTCYMNSTLQCLAHTPPIAEYFLKDFRADINAENPLGKRGELAVAFAGVLRSLWTLRDKGFFVPRIFKQQMARFSPQFNGYEQQDSQEFLGFLLEGLHEDLNKVKQAPYVEATSSDGRPDDEVGEEFWKNHKARNDSVIVDVCHGQYKSTLVCPNCGKNSVTFDIFKCLSLPVPAALTRSMTVAVFYGDRSNLWKPYTVKVPKDGSCRDLTNALGTACNLNDGETLLLAELYKNEDFKFFEDPLETLSLSEIKDNEHIVAYRLNQIHEGPEKVKLVILPAVLKKSEIDSTLYPKLFGTLLVTYINKESLSGSDINTIVSRLLSPLRRVRSGNKTGQIPDEKIGRLSSADTETEDTTVGDREFSFNLFTIGCSQLSINKLEPDTVVNPIGLTKIVLSWDEKVNEEYDSFCLDDLPEVHDTSSPVLKKARQDEISLFSCLEAYLAEEPLGEDNMWDCPDCKEKRNANKKLDLLKLPDILIFQLKRFKFGIDSVNKIDSYVSFPIHKLDLSKYVKSKDGESYVYNLYAISNHYGGLQFGHYTAYAKVVDEKEWYIFDDHRAGPISEFEIRTSAAYVLFYQRVKSSESSGTSEMAVD